MESTEWVDLWREGGGHVSCRRTGNVVELEWDFEQATGNVWAVPKALPAGLRPDRSTYFSGVATDASGNPVNKVSYCWVGWDGRTQFALPGASAGNRNCGHATWAVR
ncbi:MAG: hypothetical protein SOY67_04445 [Collinsella sp.]|nr:hypothetical protein [Collinsella sp.]